MAGAQADQGRYSIELASISIHSNPHFEREPDLKHPKEYEVPESSPGLPYPQEKPKSSPTKPTIPQKVAAELLGTYVLIFVGCGCEYVGHRGDITFTGEAITWGLVVVAYKYTFRHISFAYANPAVTIGYAAAGQFPWSEVPLYLLAQFIGSILASLNLRLLFPRDDTEAMLTFPSESTDDLTAIAWEIIITFFLMIVSCGASADERALKELSGVASGAITCINVILAGKYSGASMNPARSLGPAIAALKFRKIWIYMIAPVIGAVAASTVYRYLRTPNNSQEDNPAKKQKVTIMKEKMKNMFC